MWTNHVPDRVIGLKQNGAGLDALSYDGTLATLDANGKVVYAETVTEVANEPNYDAALAALKGLL